MKKDYKTLLYILNIIPSYIKKCFKLKKNEIILYLKKKFLIKTLFFLQNHHLLNYNFLVHITAVDYPEKKKKIWSGL